MQSGNTALMVAAAKNNVNAIEELLKGGANCNLQNKVIPVIHIYVVLLHKAWLNN